MDVRLYQQHVPFAKPVEPVLDLVLDPSSRVIQAPRQRIVASHQQLSAIADGREIRPEAHQLLQVCLRQKSRYSIGSHRE